MEDNPELLFFDTFSHGSTQELNLDLVQFTKPVFLSEIRVIPLGARVQADFPGGVRLGATNPSEFSVEFFVNDLSSPGAATFQNLGILQYNQNGPIHYECSKEIPTDGLILRGWYTTVTLAVYGFITKTRSHASNLDSQPNPPPAADTPPLRVISEHKTAEWVQQHAQVYHKESIPYDVKDLSFGEEPLEWPTEQKTDNSKSLWEKHELQKEVPHTQEECSTSRKNKRSSDEEIKKTINHKCSSPENEDHGKDKNCIEITMHNVKKLKTEQSLHGSPSKYQLFDELKNVKDEKKNEQKLPPVEQHKSIPKVSEELERLPEKEGPKVVLENSATPPMPVPLSVSLAPEDVEMISEEEISEVDDADSLSIGGLPVLDEVNETPNEVLTSSAQEDSLDLDQFEPILSESSDIESEEDLDIQDMEFDPVDLADDQSKIFNPFVFEVQPLMSIRCPFMTDYEWYITQLKIAEQEKPASDSSEKLKNLLSTIEQKPFEDGMDDWVTGIENLVPTIHHGLAECENADELMERLIKMVDIGLDFEKAYNQPKALFKVRHLKVGVFLAETLCLCNEQVTLQLIEKVNLHHRLLNEYERDHLALSVKLAILKSLDASLNYGNAVKSFVRVDDSGTSGYRRLIRLFSTSRTVRVRYALTNLLRKVHLYEALENLSSIADSLDKATIHDMDIVVVYLEEVIKYLYDAATLISQRIRFLPICTRFEFPRSNGDPYLAMYSFLRHFSFFDILLNVMRTPQCIGHPGILASVLEILAELLDTEHGLIYLASQSKVVNRILKILSNIDDHYSISPQLGLQMSHRLYVLNMVDSFQYKWQVEQMADIDNTQLLEVLSSVYYLTFTILGRQSVIHVLSRGHMIKPFLKALQYSHNTGRERRKSPARAYIADLMWMVVKGCDYVPFLERHYRDLIEIASWQSDISNSSWLNPVRSGDQCFSYSDVADLCDHLKKHADKVVTYPGELITALRILRYLAIPSHNGRIVERGEVVELKYKFVLIQLFSQEGLTFMTSMLHKICNHYERPCLHTYTLAGKEGVSMMSVVTPVLQLMRALLEYVIRCRDVEFKDLTAVPALIKTYCLLHAVPLGSFIHADATEGAKEIVDTLLAYTQTVAIETTCDKSLWTNMMSEVLKCTVSVPEMFVPCLNLISELLPLPLPIQTRTPLTDAETSLIINTRKIWSAHLLPIDGMVQEMISIFCCSSYPPLLHSLKRMCVQLADLGPPCTLVVVRSILGSLWSELNTGEKYMSSRAVRLLGLLGCLCAHPPLKIGIIQVTTGSNKPDETFAEFWSTLLRYLSQPATAEGAESNESNLTHIQGQEFIVSLIQSLCDIDISLHQLPSPSVSMETCLSNSLPPKHLFRTLCDSLMMHLETADTLSTLAAAIRTCTTLTEYDHGMFRLKTSLSEHSNALWNVIRKLEAADCGKENPEWVNCLTNLVELIKNSLPIETAVNSVESGEILRTVSISPCELAGYVKWNTQQEDEKHPLLCIVSSLDECISEEELFQPLKANMTSIMEMLRGAQQRNDCSEAAIETILDPPDSLLTQFQTRLVYVVGDVVDERLSVAYWLTTNPLDELEQEMEQVTCNLETLASVYIPNVQLEAELEKLGHRELGHAELSNKKFEPSDHTEEIGIKPLQTVLVKPAKPRTFFVRPIMGPHRNDAFRSRIPNSSRAPSLHVDDFIALEKHQQQTAAGYNRLSVKHQSADLLSAAVVRNHNLSFLQDRASHFQSSFRPTRSVLNTWHPLLAAEQSARAVVKTQSSVIRQQPSALPLLIRGADLIRFGISLSRWPSPPQLRPPPGTQLRHHPPPHSSLHRHLRPSPASFSSL